MRRYYASIRPQRRKCLSLGVDAEVLYVELHIITCQPLGVTQAIADLEALIGRARVFNATVSPLSEGCRELGRFSIG